MYTNKKHMQIPSSFQPFNKRTLIVVTNTLKAKLFLAQDQNVEEIGIIDVAADLAQESNDREALRDGGSGHDEDSTKKDHITKDHFYHALNENLMHRMQNNEFDALVFTVPEELKNELKEYLHVQLLKKTTTFVPKNLMNDDLLDIIIMIRELPEE